MVGGAVECGQLGQRTSVCRTTVFKATSRMGSRWMARGEEEARGTRTEQGCCEEEENMVE